MCRCEGSYFSRRKGITAGTINEDFQQTLAAGWSIPDDLLVIIQTERSRNCRCDADFTGRTNSVVSKVTGR